MRYKALIGALMYCVTHSKKNRNHQWNTSESMVPVAPTSFRLRRTTCVIIKRPPCSVYVVQIETYSLYGPAPIERAIEGAKSR